MGSVRSLWAATCTCQSHPVALVHTSMFIHTPSTLVMWELSPSLLLNLLSHLSSPASFNTLVLNVLAFYPVPNF